MKNKIGFLMLAACCMASTCQAADEAVQLASQSSGNLVETGWKDLLVDNAAGSVSAAGMLGIDGESITTVENVRDYMIALKGIGSSNSNGTLAFSITPARTAIYPMNLFTYAKSPAARLLGATTLGYAQSDKTISSKNYQQRAVSIETSYYFNAGDDPVVAFANQATASSRNPNDSSDCNLLRADDKPDPQKAKAQAGTQGAKNSPAVVLQPASGAAAEAEQKAIHDRSVSCHKMVTKGMRWNRSRFSLAWATGWIKPKDGNGDQISLGHTAVLGVTYGFDHSATLKDDLAVALTYRRSVKEPVLDTLQAATVNKRNSTLAVLRLTSGMPEGNLRTLLEASNAKSNDVTASQRTFIRAVGIDYRLKEAMWINFRFGQQRKIDGSSNETGSLLSLSYSPSALLPN